MVSLISETGLRCKHLYNQGQTKPVLSWGVRWINCQLDSLFSCFVHSDLFLWSGLPWIIMRLESGDSSRAHAQENMLWHLPDQIPVPPFTQAQKLWHMDFIALWHVESSRARNWTCVPCTGRWFLNHWTTREIQNALHVFIHKTHLFNPRNNTATFTL